jgi:hypothetical protein
MKKRAMNNLEMILIAGMEMIFVAAPAFAHHAFAAEYGVNRNVILTGSVTKVEWENPHTHFLLSVRDASGAFSSWDLELASPNTLERGGWTRKSLKVGDVVTVNGYLAKDGANLAHARDIHLADGRRVLAGPAPDGPAK